jgi:hypothetical protein
MGGSGETDHGELGVSCKSNDGEVAHLNLRPSSIYPFRVVCHSGDICERLDPHLDFTGVVQMPLAPSFGMLKMKRGSDGW